jgi:hypothetical protein
MRRVVQAALAAAGVDGATRCYFVLNNWELNLRERFAAISRQVTNNDTNVRPRAIGPQKGARNRKRVVLPPMSPKSVPDTLSVLG